MTELYRGRDVEVEGTGLSLPDDGGVSVGVSKVFTRGVFTDVNGVGGRIFYSITNKTEKF